MARLSEIQARIKSLAELADIVGAMRSLAAVRVQQAREALPAIRRYTDVVDGALTQAFSLGSTAARPPRPLDPASRSAAIMFSSEQGFVGAFNGRVLDRALEQIPGAGDQLLVVGSRGAALAAERHRAAAWSTTMTTRGDGVSGVAVTVAAEVYRRAALGEPRRVSLVYAKTSGGAASEVVVRALLPFDPAPFLAAARDARPPPLTNLGAGELLDKLVDELVLAELTRAAMESFASENGARLATMESAHASIEKKLDALSRDERRLRQDEVTTELLDIVTGAEAAGHEA